MNTQHKTLLQTTEFPEDYQFYLDNTRLLLLESPETTVSPNRDIDRNYMLEE